MARTRSEIQSDIDLITLTGISVRSVAPGQYRVGEKFDWWPAKPDMPAKNLATKRTAKMVTAETLVGLCDKKKKNDLPFDLSHAVEQDRKGHATYREKAEAEGRKTWGFGRELPWLNPTIRMTPDRWDRIKAHGLSRAGMLGEAVRYAESLKVMVETLKNKLDRLSPRKEEYVER